MDSDTPLVRAFEMVVTRLSDMEAVVAGMREELAAVRRGQLLAEQRAAPPDSGNCFCFRNALAGHRDFGPVAVHDCSSGPYGNRTGRTPAARAARVTSRTSTAPPPPDAAGE